MRQHPRRLALMISALCLLSVALVACQSTGSTGSGNGASGAHFTLTTPPPGSPTPTFPPFTIGAWPSNYSPNNPDTITIYIICRVQDQTMQTPAQPPNPPVTVNVLIDPPINQSFTATTGTDGIATVDVPFSVTTPGQPILVHVSAQWHGATYSNATFFTPGATFTPTPTGVPATGTPGPGTPTVTTGG